MIRMALLLMLLLLAACVRERETVRDQSARLLASFEPFRAEYSRAVEDENRLRADTLAWLRGSAVTAPRTLASSEARILMERWAKVYFVPRWMHQQLRFDSYSSSEVRRVQSRVLHHLKRRYFELHDYQRYAQHASQSAMHRTPEGYLSAPLKEFQLRLEARPAALDELGAMLGELSRLQE